MESPDSMTIELKTGERLDDLERNGYKIIQNPSVFCFGMDAVLLSGFIRTDEGSKLIDLGCGNGIIPILAAAKTAARHITGLEIQEYSADLAERSVRLNGLEDRVSIVKGDIREVAGIFEAASFDTVTSNPPYIKGGKGLTNPDEPKAIARHELLCSLEDVISAAQYLLKPGGGLFMVHRPQRLSEIFVCMSKHGLEPKRMKLVHPFIDREPNMVLLEARRGGRPQLNIEKPLIVYKSEGVYNDEIYDIYGY